jgi:hypothetical protein
MWCREVRNLTGTVGSLFTCAWITIPLVYTQLVLLVVHLYFLMSLFGQQVCLVVLACVYT